jgi:triphosphoribosyl-dephospho-CoA synthase
VAQEYATGFKTILDTGVPLLSRFRAAGQGWEESIVRLQLTLMSQQPDTLIARKLGRRVSEQAAVRAQAVLDSGWPNRPNGQLALDRFDGWLRADGHSRNPGTTADLVCASLFAGFRDKQIALPENEMLNNALYFS